MLGKDGVANGLACENKSRFKGKYFSRRPVTEFLCFCRRPRVDYLQFVNSRTGNAV